MSCTSVQPDILNVTRRHMNHNKEMKKKIAGLKKTTTVMRFNEILHKFLRLSLSKNAWIIKNVSVPELLINVQVESWDDRKRKRNAHSKWSWDVFYFPIIGKNNYQEFL